MIYRKGEKIFAHAGKEEGEMNPSGFQGFTKEGDKWREYHFFKRKIATFYTTIRFPI